MTARDKSDTRPLHETLLDDLEQMLAIYDQSVQLMPRSGASRWLF